MPGSFGRNGVMKILRYKMNQVVLHKSGFFFKVAHVEHFTFKIVFNVRKSVLLLIEAFGIQFVLIIKEMQYKFAVVEERQL